MIEALGSPLKSHNSLKLSQDEMGKETILGTFMGGDDIKIGDNVYKLTPEIYKALTSTSYTGKTMKKDNDILMMNHVKNVLVTLVFEMKL